MPHDFFVSNLQMGTQWKQLGTLACEVGMMGEGRVYVVEYIEFVVGRKWQYNLEEEKSQ